MKNPLSIILFLVLYLGLSSGITINMHFCGGDISEISLWSKATCYTCNSQEQSEEESRCPFCHEENLYLNSVDDAIILTELNENKIDSKIFVTLFHFPVPDVFTQWIFDGAELFINFELFPPPLWQSRPSLFILHCIYLI